MLVIYASPFLRKDVHIFLDRLSRIDSLQVGLISTLEEDLLPPQVSVSISGYERVDDLLSSEELVEAALKLSRRLGPIDHMFSEYELIQVPVAEARAALGLPGMSVSTMQNFRDKDLMKERLMAAGVPCARHRRADTKDDALEFAAQVGYPLIVKPLSGVGAHQTYRCDSLEELEDALTSYPTEARYPLQIEEFLHGQEHTLDTISLNGKALWHSITRYLPSPLEVLRTPWMQWRILTPKEIDIPEYDDIRRIGEQALQALNMGSNISHMEWFRRPDGSVAISEVAARPPGSRIFTALNFANDYDMYDAWVRLMTLGEFTPPRERKYAVGTAFFRGMGIGQVVDVHGLDAVLDEFGPLVVEAELPHLGQIKNDEFDGQGYLMLCHPETRIVEQAILEIVSRVRIEIG